MPPIACALPTLPPYKLTLHCCECASVLAAPSVKREQNLGPHYPQFMGQITRGMSSVRLVLLLQGVGWWPLAQSCCALLLWTLAMARAMRMILVAFLVTFVSCNEPVPEELSAQVIHELITTKQQTCLSITQYYVSRITNFDKRARIGIKQHAEKRFGAGSQHGLCLHCRHVSHTRDHGEWENFYISWVYHMLKLGNQDQESCAQAGKTGCIAWYQLDEDSNGMIQQGAT